MIDPETWPGQPVNPGGQERPIPVQQPTQTPTVRRPPGVIQGRPAPAPTISPAEQQRLAISERSADRQDAEFQYRMQQDELDRQREMEESQAQQRPPEDVLAELDNVINAATEAQRLSREGLFATGFGSRVAGNIGGTPASDVQALLQTIGGNVAFDRLQRMREESPTGGALGQVTERELALLQSTIAAMDASQSDEQFQSNMQQIIDAYQRVRGRLAGEVAPEQREDQQAGFVPPAERRTPPGIRPVTTQDIFRDGGEFGMDTFGRDNPVDRAQILMDRFGVTPSDESLIRGFWNAQSGNRNLTVEGALQWYQDNNLTPPTEEDLATAVESARSGSTFGGFDTRRAEEEVRNMLSQAIEGTAAENYGLGTLALQGAAFGLGDELQGLLGAVSNPSNPVAGYQVARDMERLGIERARERTGVMGDVAEIGGSLLTGGIRAAPAVARAAAPVRAAAREGAILGGVAGFGYGEGVQGSAANALLGAGLGSAAGAGLTAAQPAISRGVNALTERVRGPRANVTQESVAPIVQAGERRGVTVRRADVDPNVRGARGAALQGPQGPRLREAEGEDLAQIEEVLLRDLGGEVRTTPTQAGEVVQTGLRNARESKRQQAGRFYERAAQSTEGVRIEPRTALEAIDTQIAELSELGANQNADAIRYLQGVREDLARPGGLTIDTLRRQRTGLSGRLRGQNFDATDVERRLNIVLDAAGQDITQALGPDSQAGRLFARGDALWREQAEFSREVGNKLLGRNRNDVPSPDLAATRVMGFARNDPARLVRLLDVADEGTVAEIRALVAGQLGRQSNGQFQLGAFLRETGTGKGATLNPRSARALFGEDGMRAIQDLRTLAGAKVDAASQTNYSNTGGVAARSANNIRRVMLGGLGITEGGVTGGAVTLAGGEIISRLGEDRAIRMLLNPDFTKWLRTLPSTNDARAIDKSFQRLRNVASRTPGMTSDVTALERALLDAVNDNTSSVTSAVAEEENQQP